MEPNFSKANCSLCGDNKIEGGENINFAIECKISDGEKTEFTQEESKR